MTTQQSLFNFDRDLKAFGDRLGINLTTVVKKVGFDLFRSIVMKTPADTGRARASWTIAIKQPDRTVAPEGLNTSAVSSPDALAAAKATQGLTALQPYEPVWISNNLPYIGPLEQGHSKQAPNGMVALSIEEIQAQMDAAFKVVLP
jgi:hypothetical protein